MEAEALLSEIGEHWKPLFQHVMLDHTPRFSVFMLVTPTPLLFQRCLVKRPWLTMSWLGNNYPQWKSGGEKLFSVFCFCLLWLNISCVDMMAHVCTAFLCHLQTYFRHACFHEESEGSLSLAQCQEWGVYMKTACSPDTLFSWRAGPEGRDLWNLNESIRC